MIPTESKNTDTNKITSSFSHGYKVGDVVEWKWIKGSSWVKVTHIDNLFTFGFRPLSKREMFMFKTSRFFRMVKYKITRMLGLT